MKGKCADVCQSLNHEIDTRYSVDYCLGRTKVLSNTIEQKSKFQLKHVERQMRQLGEL